MKWKCEILEIVHERRIVFLITSAAGKQTSLLCRPVCRMNSCIHSPVAAWSSLQCNLCNRNWPGVANKTHIFFWHTMQTQSVVRLPNSRQALQTRKRQALHSAPLLMIRPNSTRHRAHDRPSGLFSSGRSAPRRRNAWSSVFSFLQKTQTKKYQIKLNNRLKWG